MTFQPLVLVVFSCHLDAGSKPGSSERMPIALFHWVISLGYSSIFFAIVPSSFHSRYFHGEMQNIPEIIVLNWKFIFFTIWLRSHDPFYVETIKTDNTGSKTVTPCKCRSRYRPTCVSTGFS